MIESGVLLKALRALRYVCTYMKALRPILIAMALSQVLECGVLYILCSF